MFIAIVAVYFVSENITKEKIATLTKEKYSIYSNNIYNDVELLIKNKQELTFSIALSLSKDSSIIKALKENDVSDIDLKNFSNLLRETTLIENTWFHIVDAKGYSFYRSWIPKKGDNLLNVRMDVVKMIENPQIMKIISVGKFDITFKSMVPIYDKDKFIGMFEVITHFNSIVEQLSEQCLDAIVIVDKKYKKQIKMPFSKTFLGEYYIANYNANENLLKYLETKGVEKYIHSEKMYILDQQNNHFIVVYNIPDIHEKPMASIIVFKPLNTLNMDDVKVVKNSMIKYTIIISLILLLISYYFISSKHTSVLDRKIKKRTRELLKEKQYIQKILDTNPNIIIVTNSFKTIDANKRFLEFFHYDSVEDFAKEHECISDFFVTLDDRLFSKDKMVNGLPWAVYIANNKTEHMLQLKLNDQLYVFTMSAEYLKNDEHILLTLQNVTEMKRKDRLLFEQSKLASMGEMIGNIAHQWRQPLSVIASGATGMKLQKKLNTLSDEQFEQACDLINDNAQYLSKTIDDFRDFIKGDREKTYFLLSEKFQKLLNLIQPSIKSHNIIFEINVKDDIELHGYGSELIQCFMNIFSNSKDALKNKDENSRIILVSVYKNDNQEIVISFQDSGGGILNNVIDKVFEPYFTTKHQKQGTGLGLHMTYNIIVHGMGGKIKASNQKFVYKHKEYYGALFTITLPIK